MRKQANTIIFMFILLICLPIQTHAEDDPSKKGEMRLKTDRLHERDNVEGLHETELDRIFPDLFRDKTKEKIVNKQAEMKTETNNLIEFIFNEQEIAEATFYATDELFNQDYAAPKKETEVEEMEEVDTSISQTTFIFSLIAIITGIFVFAVLLNRKK